MQAILIGAMLTATGCSTSVVEIGTEVIPMATTNEPEYTEITAPQTTTTTEKPKATFPHRETKATTETEIKKETSLYDELYTEISQFQTVIRLNRKIDTQEVSQAVSELERRHPEIFWINGYTIKYNDVSAEITLKVMNQYPAETLKQMSAELEKQVESALREINASGSDYDKALAVHDYLVEYTEYNVAAVNMGKGLWSTAYGCLIERSAVCQGYAQAFQILTNRLGLECGICSGDAKGEPHAWNYIKLNQQYYWVDVTWDDPVSDNDHLDWIHHGYFLIDDAMLSRSRTFSSNGQFIPECTDLNENYFVRNGSYLEEYSFAEIDRRLSEHTAEGRVEVMFSTWEAYQQAITDLFDNEAVWKAQIFQEAGGTINYQTDEDMYILRLIFNTTG